MKSELEGLLQKAEDTHTKNQAVYHKAMKEKMNAEKKLRAACEVASASANELAALKAAIEKMPND